MRKTFHPAGRRSMKLSPRSPAAAECSGFLRRCVMVLLLLAAVVLPCIVLYCAAPIFSSRHRPYLPVPGNRSAAIRLSGDEIRLPDFTGKGETLERILKEASMEDKTLLVATLNAAWASSGSVFELFIESFRLGIGTRKLLDHLVIVALDPKAYTRCMSIHIHCFYLPTKDVDFSEEKHFMSPGYLDMMWRRIDFLREVLELGYSFIFTDVDVMWFRNPLPVFHEDGDIQIACDHFLGNADYLENRPNGGFIYVKSNNRTIAFYNFWYSSRHKYPGRHDQDVLNFIKYDFFIVQIGLKIKFLSTEFFGGICEPSKNFNAVRTMHANCCVGLNNKLHDLRFMLKDWRIFMSLPQNIKKAGTFSWSVPQNCRAP